MDIKERMARQMRKAGVTPTKVVAKVVKSAVARNIPDRISKQINRAKVDAAIAAAKLPPPDYVYKEPRMPRSKEAADAAVKRFLEDRIYDDIPMEKSKLDPSRITTMADVHRVIISEQPREFIISTKEQVQRGSPNFGNIDMASLEGNGYADLKKDRSADLNERIVESSDEPAPMPFNAIKIDLSGGFGNVKELTPEPPAPVPVTPQPIEETSGKGDNPVEMNSVQKQMLAAMRAQRKAINL